jgi:hypothetical protein
MSNFSSNTYCHLWLYWILKQCGLTKDVCNEILQTNNLNRYFIKNGGFSCTNDIPKPKLSYPITGMDDYFSEIGTFCFTMPTTGIYTTSTQVVIEFTIAGELKHIDIPTFSVRNGPIEGRLFITHSFGHIPKSYQPKYHRIFPVLIWKENQQSLGTMTLTDKDISISSDLFVTSGQKITVSQCSFAYT